MHWGCFIRKEKCCYNFKKPYNDLMENIYVMGNKENYDWLMKGCLPIVLLTSIFVTLPMAVFLFCG
jgi:hypothetical protein